MGKFDRKNKKTTQQITSQAIPFCGIFRCLIPLQPIWKYMARKDDAY